LRSLRGHAGADAGGAGRGDDSHAIHPLYDLVRAEVYRAAGDKPLEVPENAVVVPGSRAVKNGPAADWNLSLYTPVIVKYRDEKTDRGIELEEWLR